MRPLDIAIAGCGPAGLGAALLLARDGHRVTMFERFTAAQPVGSGLMIQPTGRAVLAQLGLDTALVSHGSRIARLFGETAHGATVLDVRYAALGRGFGVGTHRATLFGLLHDAAIAQEIAVTTGHTVVGSERDGTRRRLVFAETSASRPFDLVIDALGARSPLAPAVGRELAYGALWSALDWTGAPFAADALQQRYRAASVMAGVLPIGTPPGAKAPQAAFFWSLRSDRLAAWQDAGLDAWKAEVTALWPATAPLLDQIGDARALTFARYAHRTLPHPAEPALLHIGDAWHSTSPQLGQGANMALLDAWALRRALANAENVDAALAATVRLRRRHVRLYQAMSRLFTPVYQSDSRWLPFVRDRLVGPIATRWPATIVQARMVSGLVGNPLPALGLASPPPPVRSR